MDQHPLLNLETRNRNDKQDVISTCFGHQDLIHPSRVRVILEHSEMYAVPYKPVSRTRPDDHEILRKRFEYRIPLSYSAIQSPIDQ